MRIMGLLLVTLSFVGVGLSQTSCQQQCDNFYSVCASNAEQQLNNCLNGCGGCDGGCPGGSATGSPPDPCGCSVAYDAAMATCGQNYSDCSSECNGMLPPLVANWKPADCRVVETVRWALLMRKLSRPEKLKLAL